MSESNPCRDDLKTPFVWFGGKSRVADLIWERLGVCAGLQTPWPWL